MSPFAGTVEALERMIRDPSEGEAIRLVAMEFILNLKRDADSDGES